MTGPVGNHMADNRHAEQGEIPDKIEYLMPHEFVLIAKSVLV